jgi:(4S)-4-hydroxy-5-phosphonooxypentane-2,3-dione isomerase
MIGVAWKLEGTRRLTRSRAIGYQWRRRVQKNTSWRDHRASPETIRINRGGSSHEKTSLDFRCRRYAVYRRRHAAIAAGPARRRPIAGNVCQRRRPRYRAGGTRELFGGADGERQGLGHGRTFNVQVLASDPNHVFIYEVYDNEAALQAHRASEHFKKYAATTAKMIAKREARPMSIVAANAQAK